MFDDHSDDIARRPFLKGLGAAAGAAALGVGATGAAAAHDGFHTRFANPRVQEAAQVWAEKPWRSGYRGRPDRTLAINDSGIEIAHPDLGPWNEVTAIGSGRSGRPEVRLTDPDSLSDWRESRRQVGEERSQTTVLGPGTTIEGSDTAFTAAPYHKHPVTYRHTGRDTYLGYGRVNPDTAVDAVTRDLFDGPAATSDASASISGTVGLDVPTDSRAIAGFVQVGSGTLEVDLAHSHYAGGNTGMTHGVPWLDLYVYDAENPGRAGTPTVLESAQGPQGSASVSVDVAAEQDDPTTPEDETATRTLFVVAKLVNVPGVVNGYDVRSHVDIDLAFSADDIPVVTTEFTASGSRSDDGSAFTGGQTNRVKVTVDDFQHAEEVAVTDQVPDGWTVDEDYADVEEFDADNGVVHFEGTVTAEEVGKNGSVSLSYFAEAPEGADQTGPSTFGPAEAEVVVPDVPDDDTDGDLDGDGVDTFGGTDNNLVVGPSTET
jgi:hypothetical protein